MKKIDLSKKQAQRTSFATPPALGETHPGFKGKLPMPVGKVMRGVKPTDSEREILEAVGWKDGDPVPSDLAEIFDMEVKAARKSATEDLQPPVDPSTPRMVMPQEIPLSALPPGKRAEIISALRQAKETAAVQDLYKDQQEGLSPSIAQAVEAAAYQAPTLNVVDDRKSDTYAGTTVKKQKEEDKLPDFGADKAITTCPHCSSNLADPVQEASKEDKFVFIQTLLAGKPFEKTYSLYDGQIEITFRGLTVKEGDLCVRQCNDQKENGDLKTLADVYEENTRYSMALQTVKLKSAGDTFDLPDSIDGWKESFLDSGIVFKEGETLLTKIKEWYFDNVVKTESLGRIVSMVLSEFNRLNRYMEVNHRNANFLKGTIESPLFSKQR